MSITRRLRSILQLPFRLALRGFFYYPKVAAALIAKRRGKITGIVEALGGSRRFLSGRYAIFVIWQPKSIPWYVQNALDALAAAEVNVILTSNCALSAQTRDQLLAQCHTLIVRDNSGFDFGAYQDATLHASQHFDDVERMIYLNDSIYFFNRGLTEFVERLARSSADACAAFENWERHYHLQSFALSVSGRMFKSAPFINFWRNYLPASARRWAIHAGEIGLSKTIVPNAESIEIIYGPNDLLAGLEKLTQSELLSVTRTLPATQRLGEGEVRLRGRQLIDHIVMNKIPGRSQIHTAGFLAHRYLGCPIVKRDLVYRLQFTVYDVEHGLRSAGTTECLDHVLTEMRRKGPGTQLPLLKRLQFLDGII